MTGMFSRTIPRRELLQRALQLAGIAGLAQACAPASTPPTATAPAAVASTPAASAPTAAVATTGAPTASTAARRAQLPSYIPFAGPTPDLAGDAAAGVDPGFLTFPKTPTRSVADKPGRGSDLSAFTVTFSGPPP